MARMVSDKDKGPERYILLFSFMYFINTNKY